LGLHHYAYAFSLCTLAVIAQARGEDATAWIEEALLVARELADSDSEHALVIISHAAEYALSSGQETWARALTSELEGLHALHLGPEHPRSQASAAAWRGRLSSLAKLDIAK
jgi:hypothetical protein